MPKTRKHSITRPFWARGNVIVAMVIMLFSGCGRASLTEYNPLDPVEIFFGNDWRLTISGAGAVSFVIIDIDNVKDSEIISKSIAETNHQMIVRSIESILNIPLNEDELHNVSTGPTYKIMLGNRELVLGGTRLLETPRRAIYWKSTIDLLGFDPDAPSIALGFYYYEEYGLIGRTRPRPRLKNIFFDPTLGIWVLDLHSDDNELTLTLSKNGGLIETQDGDNSTPD